MSAPFVRAVLAPAAALAALAAPLRAQTPNFSAEISVELVNLEVHVVDRDGNPVEGLPRDAFRVFEGDRPAAISHFAWVPPLVRGSVYAGGRNGAQGGVAIAEPRRLAILFDEMQVGDRSRRPLLDALREQLATGLAPGDEVSVVRFTGADLELLLPFTDDRRKLGRALDDLESFSLHRVAQTQELRTWLDYLRSEIWDNTARRSDVCPNVGQIVQNYADIVRRDVEASAAAVLRYGQRLSHEPGRKVLLHVSDGIPLVAGGEVYELAVQMCSGSAAAQGVPGAYSTSTADPSGEFQSDRFNPRTGALDVSSYQMGTLWTEVAARLNVLGITAYPIQAGEAGTAFFNGVEANILPASVRTMATQNPVDTLALLAEETGGLLLQAGRGAESEVARLLDDLGGYYSIAFTPDPEGKPGLRRVRVEVDRDGVDLRYRQSYRLESRDERIAGQLAELFYAERIENPLQLRLDVRRVEGAPDPRLRILVPFDQLALIDSPTGGQEGRFTVYVAVRRESGRVMTPRQKSIVARRADPNALAYTYEVALPQERGDVAVAIVDDYSGTVSFARERLVVR